MDAQNKQKDDLSARTLNDLARIIAIRTQGLARGADGEPFTRVWPQAIFEGRFEDE